MCIDKKFSSLLIFANIITSMAYDELVLKIWKLVIWREYIFDSQNINNLAYYQYVECLFWMLWNCCINCKDKIYIPITLRCPDCEEDAPCRPVAVHAYVPVSLRVTLLISNVPLWNTWCRRSKGSVFRSEKENYERNIESIEPCVESALQVLNINII